jgi:hypothetical protein
MIDKQNRQRWRRVATGLVLVFVLALSLSAVGTAAASDGDADAPVREGSNFEVNIDNVEIETLQTLDEGDDSTSFPGVRLNVLYSVVNTGDTSDTQTITLVGKSDLATVQLGSQNVSLAPGQSHSDRFSHSLDSFGESCLPPCEPVSGTLVLSSEDDTDTKTVSLSQSPRFVIDGVQTNSPVEGEDLVVDVAVRNAGGASGTQTLDVDAGPLGSESATLSLKAGELTTQTVVFPTSAGDAGTYDLSASTENDTASATAEVRSGGGDEAFFAVSIENTKVEVPDPEQPIIMSSGWTATVAVEYTVANAGNASDTQQIGFSVAGEQQDNETVTLDAGQSHAGEFVADVPIFGILTEPNVVPAPPYEAEVTVAVSSADDRAEETVVVGPGEGSAEFVIEGIETNEPVEGDDLVAEVRLSNVGDASGTQSLDVDAGPLGSDSASVSLASGESTSQSFAFSTSQGDAGTYDLSASTADDTASTAFAVQPADGGEANFDVSIDDARVEVPDPGEPVPLPPVEEPIEFGFGVVVEYTVENTGNASDTQQIGFEIEDRQRDATELRLDAGESASGTFSHSLSVYGEDGEGVLAGGASGEMQEVINETSLLPEPPYVPELTVAVTSEDDRAEETISLDPGEDPPTFEINEVTTNDPVAGDDLEVSVQVTNTGDVVDSQQLTVDAGDLGSSSQLLLLAGGESATQTVALSTSEGDAGTYAVTAATGDDRANATARVRAGDEDAANFDVSIDDARVELPGSGPIVWPATEFEFGVVVEYTVENTGNASDTQPIVLAVEDEQTNKTTASLGPGERAAGTLSATVPIIKPLSSPAVIPEPPYTPEVTVAISSEDDRAEETVALEPPVEEPPTFVIDSINASSPVAGEELVVDLQVTNTGDVVDSQTVAVDAGELGRESRLQLLGPGETVVQRFTFPTGAGDAGTYDVTAETGDDRASTTATVQPVDDSEAVFEVDIDDTRVNVSSPIQPGPLPPVDSTIDLNVTLEADYTVANAGNATDTQAVVFAVNDERQASEQVSLGAGERTSGTFSTQLSVSEIQPPDRPCLVPHGEACLPHVTVVISTDDDRATEEVTIGPGGGPMPTVTENPPLDLDGDGLHEDLRGDGQANILDVQALFNLLGDDRVQQNADAFSFQSDGAGEVTILDVQGLFNELDRADS